jgi:hypothetical protein
MKTQNKRMKFLAVCQIFFGVGLMAYWAMYFLTARTGRASFLISAEHAAFEAAFPAADFVLAAAQMVSGIYLFRGAALGMLLCGACGGALIFLGLLDTSFNLQNGVYSFSPSLALMNLTINGLCVGFGLWLMVHIWRLKPFCDPVV